MKTRAEHLEWCKQRANELIDNGNVTEAFASMGSDLNKHPETEGHIGVQMGMMQMMGGHLESPDAMRRFIDGFN